MAIQPHVAERNIEIKAVGGIGLGVDTGILVAGDLTSLTAAKAAVDTDVAKQHTAEQLDGVRCKAALDQVDNFLTGATTGTSTANILALLPGCKGSSPVL